MRVDNNICDDADSYKHTHHLQYPKDTKFIHSYLESRHDASNAFTVFYGLQMVLLENLVGEVVTQEKIDEAAENSMGEFGHALFNKAGWEYILNEHKGKLPVEIRAVPEGLITPSRNVLVTVENTDENVPWLTNYLETILLHVWYPTTVATNSYRIRALIDKYAIESGTRVTPYHVHDFGFRGASSAQTAGYGGSAHLINFLGSDTRIARRYAKTFYNAKNEGLSSSIYAAEHSTVTMYGRDNELEAYRNIIDNANKDFPMACVSDSYNHWIAVEDYFGQALKDKILARNAKTVVRPDSGNPIEVSDKTITMLMKYYGFTTNDLGYKTLNPKIGVIYSDRICEDVIKNILERIVKRQKYTTDNIVFGIGGALLQQVNRDTYKFAFKASAGYINDEWRDIKKTVVTEPMKESKAGRLKLIVDEETGKYKTVNIDADGSDVLKTVFKNGKLIKKHTFEEIRRRAGWKDYYG